MNHEDFMKYEEKKGHGTYMLPFAVYGELLWKGQIQILKIHHYLN